MGILKLPGFFTYSQRNNQTNFILSLEEYIPRSSGNTPRNPVLKCSCSKLLFPIFIPPKINGILCSFAYLYILRFIVLSPLLRTGTIVCIEGCFSQE